MSKRFKNLMSEIKGQGLIQYGLIIALISIIVLTSLLLFGGEDKDGECIQNDDSLSTYVYKKNNDTGLISVYKNITCVLGGWNDKSEEEIAKKNKAIQAAKDAGFEFNEKIEPYTIIGYNGNDEDLEIPSEIGGVSVIAIGKEAFKGKGLTSVKLPDTIKSIQERAFYDNKLTKVIIDGTSEIGMQAFQNNGKSGKGGTGIGIIGQKPPGTFIMSGLIWRKQ